MTGTVFVALLAGHLVGDWIVQTDRQAANKARSWPAMIRHVASYHTAMAVFLLPVLWSPWAAAILGVSAATHALLDRRWPVIRLMRAVGNPKFAEQQWGVFVVDQSLHVTILAVCALTVGQVLA